jgi:signal transduction histidine kinase
MNILSNAIDAIEEKMRKNSLSNPQIFIYTELIGDSRVNIRIADNGLGIPEQVKQNIFNPFFTTKPVGVGTGMGLAISYQIITERHRGSLHCVSELGQGSEFIIQIPLKQGLT